MPALQSSLWSDTPAPDFPPHCLHVWCAVNLYIYQLKPWSVLFLSYPPSSLPPFSDIKNNSLRFANILLLWIVSAFCNFLYFSGFYFWCKHATSIYLLYFPPSVSCCCSHLLCKQQQFSFTIWCHAWLCAFVPIPVFVYTTIPAPFIPSLSHTPSCVPLFHPHWRRHKTCLLLSQW